jgi:uncharacterized membrane protein
VIPFGKEDVKFAVPHIEVVKREIFFGVTFCGHFTHPQVFAFIVPWAPKSLIHGCTGTYFKGYANMIYFDMFRMGPQGAFDIFCRFIVLHFVVHVKNAYLPVKVILYDIFQAEIQQYAAILTAGQ